MYGVVDVGVVSKMSALREAGKSLRRSLVSWMWWVGREGGAVVGGAVVGAERVRDQASPLRKRGVEEVVGGVEEMGVVCRGEVVWVGRLWVALRRAGRLCSSHCVVHVPWRKSGCEVMARRMGRFVCTPVMCVSSSARWAFRTAASQDEAVMMSLAIRLSKSAETMAVWPLMR